MRAPACSAWIAAAIVPILAGCVTTPAMRPVVKLDDRSCAAAPSLDPERVQALPFEKPVVLELDQDIACLESRDGRRSSYVVLALPQRSESYVVAVTSSPRGTTLFSPRMQLLDAAGRTLRERPRDAFMFHGTALYAGMRAYPEDRFLLVTSDPETVGQQVSRIVSTTQANAVPVGTGIMFVYTGSEGGQSAVFSHNGSLTISAQPLARVN
ncbi:MAG: hypothetical protein JNK67_00230 [Alphaproteobacteria bacterium]|nr:hypothetical protein [Alphaproteobacteria bacterium]